MSRRLSHLPFVSIFDRGNGIYDITELPRIIAYSVDRYNPIDEYENCIRIVKERRGKRFSKIILICSSNGTLIVEQCIEINGKKYDRERVGTLDLSNRVRYLIEEVLTNAKLFSISTISSEKTQITISDMCTICDTVLSEHIYNVNLKDNELTDVLHVSDICSFDSIKYFWSIRTATLKGILRYTLFKLITLYSIYNLVHEEHSDDLIIPLLVLLGLILTHDDENFVFTNKDEELIGISLKSGIPLLHSLIFGSGMNKSLISIDFLDIDSTQSIIKYVIDIQYNSLISLILLDNILNKFRKCSVYTNSISIEHIINGLLCLIVGSLNYISSLKGPLVSVLPKYRLLRQLINCISVRLYVSDELGTEELIKNADRFLKFYVHEYIFKNIYTV